jgi:hypothetical protein
LTKENPAFKSAEAYFYLAYRNNEIVGRILSIGEVNDQQKKKEVRFGWFDVIDIEVTKALLEKVYELEKWSRICRGPMGFSNLDKVSLLKDLTN